MNQAEDDAIEVLLRTGFDGPVVDAGFAQQVMRQLPQRRRRVTWPLWAGVVTGATTCWFALLPSRLLRDGWQDWIGGHWSVAGSATLLTAVVMILLALAWGVAETEDG